MQVFSKRKKEIIKNSVRGREIYRDECKQKYVHISCYFLPKYIIARYIELLRNQKIGSG